MAKPADKPLVSVIIATYNSAQTLRLAIQSILAQDFTNYDVWIIGDACSDDSEQVVLSFADGRLHWINLATNSGSQGIPNNEGIRHAGGDYIAYLGHDDLWFPWHLSGLVDFMEETGGDLVHPLSAAFDPSGLRFTLGPPSEGKSYEDHFIYPSCWLHRRRLVDECGYWGDADKLPRRVDMDFLRRVHLAGKKILFYPRLGMLKFPSPWWGTYAPGFHPPQADFLARMGRDALELEREILFQAATVLARRIEPRMPVRQAFRQLLLSMAQRGIRSFGSDNRLLDRLRFIYLQRDARKRRKRRGLPPRRR